MKIDFVYLKSQIKKLTEIIGAEPHVILLCYVAFIDLFAVGLFIPILPSYLVSLGASATVVGLASSLYGALQLFSGPAVGLWSDEHGISRCLLFSLFLSGGAYFGMALTHSLTLFMVTRTIAGLCKHTQTLTKANLSAHLAESSDSQRLRALGLFQAAGSLGFVVGPTLGGFVGFCPAAAIAAGLFMLNTAFVPYINSARRYRKPSVNGEVESACQSMWKLNLILPLVQRFLLSFGMIALRSIFHLLLAQHFGISLVALGALTSLQSAAGVIASLAAGPIAKSFGKTFPVIAAVLQTAALLFLLIAPTVFLMTMTAVVLSIANSLLRVICSQLVLSRMPVEKHGATLGLSNSASSLARMIAPLLTGIVYDFDPVLGGCVPWVASAAGSIVTVFIVFQHKQPIDDEKMTKS